MEPELRPEFIFFQKSGFDKDESGSAARRSKLNSQKNWGVMIKKVTVSPGMMNCTREVMDNTYDADTKDALQTKISITTRTVLESKFGLTFL